MLSRLCAVALVSLICEAPALASPGRPAPPPTAALRTPARGAPAPVTSAERSRYAAREAAAPDAQKYRGGSDVVIISVSAGAVALALAVVLAIVLL